MREEIINAREQVKQVMESTGLDATNLAREAGIDPSTLTRLMGKQPKNAPNSRTLMRIMDVARRCSPVSPSAFSLSGEDFIIIPEYNVEAAAGNGAVVPDVQGLDKNWQIPKEALSGVRASSLQNLAILTVAGDSMAPDYMPGDRILIDIGDRIITHDGAYVLNIGMGLVVKLVQVLPTPQRGKISFRIISKNPDYPPYEVECDDIIVNGRVVGKWVWK